MTMSLISRSTCPFRLYFMHVLLLQALVTVKDKLAETEGPDVKEQMQDEIRRWFIETRCVYMYDNVYP